MTLAFWIAAAAITVLALVVLIVPLVRKPKNAVPARVAFDLTVYKDQLAEVDRDLERGVLDEDQASAARTEIERRMLAASAEDGPADAGGSAPVVTPRLSRVLAIVIVVAVPLGAGALYDHLGNPGLADHPLAERRAQGGMQTAQGENELAQREAQLRAMIKDIEKRAEQDPSNPRNWAVLGQAYQLLGDHGASIQAFEKLTELTDRHPDALVLLAEAMVIAANGTVSETAEKLFLESRAQDPGNPMTYYYIALAREQAGDPQGAVEQYAGLLAVSPENAEWVPDIQARMQAAASEAGVDVPTVQMLPPMETAPAPAGPIETGPSAEQMEDAQKMSPEDQRAMIEAMVQRVEDRVKDDPDNIKDWKILAQAYRVLGNAEGLAEAEANIERLENGQ